MAQQDYIIDNDSGANVRADINLVLQAILTQNSGTTEPTSKTARMFWTDTTASVLKQRNAGNTAWTTLLSLDGLGDINSVGIIPKLFSVATGTANAISVAIPSITALADKELFMFKALLTNTAPTTINVSSLGVKALVIDNVALSGGEVLIAEHYFARYNLANDNFELIVLSSSGGLTTGSEAQTKIGDLTIGEEIAVSSWSYSGTTITINTSTAHNLIVGKTFYIHGLESTTNAPNGNWTVATVEDSDTITFTADDTPTGSPTVSSALITSGLLNTKSNVKIIDFGTVTNNNRYVIDNPFGNANYEGCIINCQIYANGMWSNTGWYSGGTRGTQAHSNLEGIVVQTCLTSVIHGSSVESMGGHGWNSSQLTSAPCRVIVYYIGEATDA